MQKAYYFVIMVNNGVGPKVSVHHLGLTIKLQNKFLMNSLLP